MLLTWSSAAALRVTPAIYLASLTDAQRAELEGFLQGMGYQVNGAPFPLIVIKRDMHVTNWVSVNVAEEYPGEMYTPTVIGLIDDTVQDVGVDFYRGDGALSSTPTIARLSWGSIAVFGVTPSTNQAMGLRLKIKLAGLGQAPGKGWDGGGTVP